MVDESPKVKHPTKRVFLCDGCDAEFEAPSRPVCRCNYTFCPSCEQVHLCPFVLSEKEEAF